METAKQANQLIKKALEILTDENDLAHFSNVPEIFNNASGMVNGDEYCEAMLKGWMVSQANNIMFLLWRRGLLTQELEDEYRELPSTEEAVKDFDGFEKANAEKANELEAARKEFMDAQHKTDIFKAVLNGMSKEKAEEEYAKMQAQIEAASKA